MTEPATDSAIDALEAQAKTAAVNLVAHLRAARHALRGADDAICSDPRTATGYGSGSPDIPALGIIRAALALEVKKAPIGEAPVAWRVVARAEWRRIPPDAQLEILRREQDIIAALEAAAAARRDALAVLTLLDQLWAEGVDLDQGERATIDRLRASVKNPTGRAARDYEASFARSLAALAGGGEPP